MFLIYRVNEIFHERSIQYTQPDDAIYDVFYRFSPDSLTYIESTSDLKKYTDDEMYMDCGDWSKGYSSYYNVQTKVKFLVIDSDFKHINVTIKKLIRVWKLKSMNI